MLCDEIHRHVATDAFSMKINIALSASANLLALLNEAHPGKNFSQTNVTVGTPVANPGNGGRNTSIDLTAVQDQGYSGVTTVNYTRLALAPAAAIATAKAVDINITLQDDQAAILTKVAQVLGLVESELELSDLDEPTSENNPGSVNVNAKVGSLLYTGTYAATLTVSDSDVPLPTAVTNPDLNGFEPEA